LLIFVFVVHSKPVSILGSPKVRISAHYCVEFDVGEVDVDN